jgi:hypothetical protein
MKKVLIMVLLSISILQGKMFNITKIIGKVVKDKDSIKTTRFIKQLDKSPYARRMIAPNVINSPILNTGVKKICQTQPKFCSLSKTFVAFSKKSEYADKLLTTTDYPLDVIRFHMKHGNGFLETIKEFGIGVSKVTSSHVELLRKKFPNMPQIQFENMKKINDKMLLTLRYTGKKGWEATQELLTLAKKYPKSATVATLMAWYISDPESFFEQKANLIDFVGSTIEEGVSDVTKLTLNASSGVADGFTSVLKEKATFSNLMVLFLLFLSFIIWKLREYIKEYVTIKLNNSLKKAKNQSIDRDFNEDREGLL